MKNLNFQKISWKEFEKNCFILAKKIQALPKNEKIDTIVAISRGGLVPARILSDFLSIHISHITISSYNDLKQKKETVITESPSRSFRNETILLVDEVSDSGKTFKRALSYFSNFHIKKIYTLAPYLKPESRFIPDFWAVKSPDWFIFPYELKETVNAIKKMYKTDKKVLEKLRRVGFTKGEIENLL